MNRYRSRGFMTLLSYLVVMLVIALAFYWILTILLPPPAGWSNEGLWVAVSDGDISSKNSVADQNHSAKESKTPSDQTPADRTKDQHERSENDGKRRAEELKEESEEESKEELKEESKEESKEGKAGDEGSRININEADAERLQMLPGIGPVKAEAILEYRREKGPFSSVDELLQVKGIGEKTLEKLRPHIKIN